MTRTAADFMAESLAQAGVKRIYGIVGDSLNGFTDSLRRMKKIDWVHMRCCSRPSTCRSWPCWRR
jgi:pyruvate dehydrogenase (quinone)